MINKKSLLWSTPLLVFFAFSAAVFWYSPLRNSLRKHFDLPERRILSVASGEIFPDGKTGRVLKLLTKEGIVLEVYGTTENNVSPLLDTIRLEDKRDAQFQFRGRATNLALKDMDGDHVFEIIAPSYDDSLVPHLNIFRYNSSTGHFERFTD